MLITSDQVFLVNKTLHDQFRGVLDAFCKFLGSQKENDKTITL